MVTNTLSKYGNINVTLSAENNFGKIIENPKDRSQEQDKSVIYPIN